MKRNIKLVLLFLCLGFCAFALSVDLTTAEDTPTGHADVGDTNWGKTCGANADGSPNSYCRWAAGVDCCNSGHGKLAKEGTASGNATDGWDYDCTANTCPDGDDCKSAERSAVESPLQAATP